jgi:hypothetical protein
VEPHELGRKLINVDVRIERSRCCGGAGGGRMV